MSKRQARPVNKPTPKSHARFSASGAAKWLACPGSVRLSEKCPPLPDSIYATEGTTAHEVVEYLIRNRHKHLAASEFLRKKYGLQMVVHAETALKYVTARMSKLDRASLVIEAKCDLPTFEPGQYGTTDLGIVQVGGLLEVIDYKYGAGIPVQATESKQLTYYAIGLAHQFDYDFKQVRLTIIQPRRAIDGKFVRSWDTTPKYLREQLEVFEEGMALAKRPKAPLRAGDHCRFCAAKSICPETKNAALRRAQDDFDDGYVD